MVAGLVAFVLAALVTVSTLALLVVVVFGMVVVVTAGAPALAIGLALLISPRLGRRLARGRVLLLRRAVRRALAVVGGVTAVLIPTLFGLFPHWGLNWGLTAKLCVLIGWLIAALLVVLGTVRASELLERLDASQRTLLYRGRKASEELLVRAWLAPSNTNLGPDYAPQLFVPDRWQRRLTPLFDPGGWGPEDGWRIAAKPHPVTVEAWETNSYAHVKGPAVTGAQYGLNRQQQERYSGLSGVAAYPVRDVGGRKLGVLVFLTTIGEGDSRIGEPEFIQLLSTLAEVLAHVLVNVGGIVGED